MKSTKTKMIIVILSIIVVAIVTLLIITKMMPKTTESKQEDLWEYAFSGNVSTMFKSYFEGEDYETALSDKKYETTTDISFTGNIAGEEELTNHLENLEINISGKVNNETNQAMGNAIVNYMRNEMFKLDYIKDNQSYGIKSDEVIDMYLGIRNSDLDVLAQKFGIIINTKKLEIISYKDLLIDSSMINSTMNNIKMVLKEQISTDKFTKQSKRKIELCGTEVTVDSYTLILNDQETYSVLTKILEKVLEDEQLLNSIDEKISILLNNAGQNETTSKEIIQSYIHDIQTKTFTNEQMVMATIYVLDNKMVKLDISITQNGETNQYIIEALESSNTMNLTINKQNQENVRTTNCSINKDEKQIYTITMKATENDEEKFNLELKTKTEGSLESGNLTNASAIRWVKDESDIEIKIVSEIKIVDNIEIENLSASNCSFVNDMEVEKIEYLYKAISERLVSLYNQKIQLIDSGELQQQIIPANEDIEKHNAEFDVYEGEYSGTIVVEMLNKVIQSNATSEYLIGIETKLTETDETVLEESEVTVEKVQPLANLLESDAIYTITMNYQPVSGAIDKIEIVKNGLSTTEVENNQVVIQ